MATNRQLLGFDDEPEQVAPTIKPQPKTPMQLALERHRQRLLQEQAELNTIAKLPSDDTRETEREIIRSMGRMI